MFLKDFRFFMGNSTIHSKLTVNENHSQQSISRQPALLTNQILGGGIPKKSSLVLYSRIILDSSDDGIKVHGEYSGERLEPHAAVAVSSHTYHGADLVVGDRHPGPPEVGLEVLEPDLAVPVAVH